MVYIYFILLAFIWSYSWIVAKIALTYIDPIRFSFFRTLLGFIVIFLFSAFFKKLKKPSDIFLIILLGLTQTSGFFIFANLALLNGGAGKVSILIYTMPFWSIMLAKLFLNEPITHTQKLSIILVFVGLTFIIGISTLKASLLSDIFAILSAISWAISIIIAKIILNKQKLDALSLTVYQMFFGCFGILIPLVFMHPTKATIISNYLIFAIAYSSIIATALGWFLWLYILQKIKVNIISLSSLIVPMLAIIESWLQLGETPSATESLGITLIALSLILIYIETTKKTLSGH